MPPYESGSKTKWYSLIGTASEAGVFTIIGFNS
jgi:hypothetical protein